VLHKLCIFVRVCKVLVTSKIVDCKESGTSNRTDSLISSLIHFRSLLNARVGLGG